LAERKLKKDEKEKIGDMLVEFFESEMAVDDLIVSVIELKLGALENAKETLLPFIPARRKMEFLEKHSIVNKKTSHLFQRLHDQRNTLAHPQGREKRPGKMVTPSVRKQFIEECSTVLKALYEAHVNVYEQDRAMKMALQKKVELEALNSLIAIPQKPRMNK
jgi:hypothetical protein